MPSNPESTHSIPSCNSNPQQANFSVPSMPPTHHSRPARTTFRQRARGGAVRRLLAASGRGTTGRRAPHLQVRPFDPTPVRRVVSSPWWPACCFGTRLAFVAEYLDDRVRTVENDPRAVQAINHARPAPELRIRDREIRRRRSLFGTGSRRSSSRSLPNPAQLSGPTAAGRPAPDHDPVPASATVGEGKTTRQRPTWPRYWATPRSGSSSWS